MSAGPKEQMDALLVLLCFLGIAITPIVWALIRKRYLAASVTATIEALLLAVFVVLVLFTGAPEQKKSSIKPLFEDDDAPISEGYYISTGEWEVGLDTTQPAGTTFSQTEPIIVQFNIRNLGPKGSFWANQPRFAEGGMLDNKSIVLDLQDRSPTHKLWMEPGRTYHDRLNLRDYVPLAIPGRYRIGFALKEPDGRRYLAPAPDAPYYGKATSFRQFPFQIDFALTGEPSLNSIITSCTELYSGFSSRHIGSMMVLNSVETYKSYYYRHHVTSFATEAWVVWPDPFPRIGTRWLICQSADPGRHREGASCPRMLGVSCKPGPETVIWRQQLTDQELKELKERYHLKPMSPDSAVRRANKG